MSQKRLSLIHTTRRYNAEPHTPRIIKYGRTEGNTWLKLVGAFLQRSFANTSKEVTIKPHRNRLQAE
jgi:hypothetical protein